jgi:hypothetical protein
MSGSTQSHVSYADGGLNETITQAATGVFAAEVDYDYSPYGLADGSAFGPPATPEPATFILIGGALIALGVVRKRRV